MYMLCDNSILFSVPFASLYTHFFSLTLYQEKDMGRVGPVVVRSPADQEVRDSNLTMA